jgi:hypothetical protein
VQSRTAAPIVFKPPMPAPGVSYEPREGTTRLFFPCTAYRATLSREACADRWRSSQGATGAVAERVSLCRGCVIGASHAGHEPVVYSRHYGAAMCPRCRKPSFRIIGGRVCVSCANREYELIKGLNARGTVPVILAARPPVNRRLIEVANDIARPIEATNVIDLAEALLRRLRTSKGTFAFAWQGDSSALRQQRLF